jgi:hypothetical protein
MPPSRARIPRPRPARRPRRGPIVMLIALWRCGIHRNPVGRRSPEGRPAAITASTPKSCPHPRHGCLSDRRRPLFPGLDARPIVEGVDVELTHSRHPLIEIGLGPVGGRNRFVDNDFDGAFLRHLRVAPHDFAGIAADLRGGPGLLQERAVRVSRVTGLLLAGRYLGRLHRVDDVVHAEGAQARA